MSKLSTKTIVLGITGGIAAYKSCELVREMMKRGFDVHVILTEAAKHFVTPLTLQTLSRNPVYMDMFSLPFVRGGLGWGREESTSPLPSLQRRGTPEHVSLADRADLILVAPACANTIAKVAHGICDDLLTTTICATKAPVIFAPSMNVNMWKNPITQENISRLKKFGYQIIDPEEGELACGYRGVGRLAEPKRIVDVVESIIKRG